MEKIIIQGRSGSGKTVLASKLAGNFKRLIVFDTLYQFDIEHEITDPIDLVDFLIEKGNRPFKVVFRPETTIKKPKNLLRVFELVCSIIFECENVCFLADEVDLYTSAQKIPEYFNGLVQRGRHRNISIIATTRRQAETSRMFTAQATKIITFRQTEKTDIDGLKNYFGDRAEEIKTLGRYEWLCYDVDKQTITKGGGVCRK